MQPAWSKQPASRPGWRALDAARTARRQRFNMKTILYLIRHGATEANLAQPPLLQGRRHNPPLARVGIRQAEATRDFLAIRPIDCCYSSPLLRAVQTAAIVAAPHGIS